MLSSLLACATYHLLIAEDDIASIQDAMGRSMSLVLLALEYDGTETAAKIAKEIDTDFRDILTLSQRMPWDDDSGIDPVDIKVLRDNKRFQSRVPPRRSEVERALLQHLGEYGKPEGIPERRCVFCGKPPVKRNREHVIPEWLMKMTGKPNRKVRQRFPGGKILREDLTKYNFPACSLCNAHYGKTLETHMRPIFDRLLKGESVYHDELALMLDWLDKVRIGVWLGQMMRDDRVSVVPKFHIQQRIGTIDRMCLIARSSATHKGLTWGPGYDPIFTLIPSFFCLAANEISIVSVSSVGIALKLLGYPYPAAMSAMHDGRTECRFLRASDQPVSKRLTFVDSRFAIVTQAVLPDRLHDRNPYAPVLNKLMEEGGTRSRVHVVSDGCITRLDAQTPFQVPCKFEKPGMLQWVSVAILDTARRWAMRATPPPLLGSSRERNRIARNHYFEHLKLAELGHSCYRLD